MTDSEKNRNAAEGPRAFPKVQEKGFWRSRAELWGNLAALILGTLAGWGIVSVVITCLGAKGGNPFLVIAVGVGVASFFGALLRVLAHTKIFAGASTYVDMAGKALAMVTALQLIFQTWGRLQESITI